MTLRPTFWLWIILFGSPAATGQDTPASLPGDLPALPATQISSPGLPTGPVLDSTTYQQTEPSADPDEPTRIVPSDEAPTEVVPAPTDEVAPIEEAPPGSTEEMIEGEPIDERIVGEEIVDDGGDSCIIGDFTFDFPRWYVRTEAMYLDRTTQGDLATATTRDLNGNLGNYRVDSASFHHTPGVRVIAGRNFNDGMTYFELAYTGLFDWTSSKILGIGTDLDIVDPNLNVGLIAMGFTGSQEVNRQLVKYDSILNDGEVNIRSFMSPGFAVIFGIRFMALNEDLIVAERGGTAVGTSLFPYTAQRDIAVENGILAAQMGGDFYCDIWEDVRLNLLGKIGLGGNFSKSTVRQATQVDLPFNLGPISSASRVQIDDEVVLAGILDTAAGLDIQLTRNIVFRGGYHLMWLNGVAVATEQHVNIITDQNGPQRQIENSANVFLYGPYVGLQITWGGLD